MTDRKEEQVWMMKIKDNKISFMRLHEGKPIESYSSVDLGVGVINAAAIIQGYEPIRSLVCLDKLAD